MADSIVHPAPRPIALAGHPVYAVLLPIPLTCFVATLITDCAYLGTADMLWLDCSSWLLLAGLVAGGLAGLVLIAEAVRRRHVRTGRLRLHLALMLAAWIVAVFNSFIHARDGWTAVMPLGLTLSIAGAVLALAAGWLWQSFRVGAEGGAR